MFWGCSQQVHAWGMFLDLHSTFLRQHMSPTKKRVDWALLAISDDFWSRDSSIWKMAFSHVLRDFKPRYVGPSVRRLVRRFSFVLFRRLWAFWSSLLLPVAQTPSWPSLSLPLPTRTRLEKPCFRPCFARNEAHRLPHTYQRLSTPHSVSLKFERKVLILLEDGSSLSVSL